MCVAAGRAAGEEAAAPIAAVAPRGTGRGESSRSAVASIAHDWDAYLLIGHTGRLRGSGGGQRPPADRPDRPDRRSRPPPSRRSRGSAGPSGLLDSVRGRGTAAVVLATALGRARRRGGRRSGEVEAAVEPRHRQAQPVDASAGGSLSLRDRGGALRRPRPDVVHRPARAQPGSHRHRTEGRTGDRQDQLRRRDPRVPAARSRRRRRPLRDDGRQRRRDVVPADGGRWAGSPRRPGDLRSRSTPAASRGGIASGSDGNLWFTKRRRRSGRGAIVRLTLSGQATEFPLSEPGSGPEAIVPGPDGNLWFTEQDGERIGRITPAGAITEFPIGARPADLVAGHDGNIWYSTDGAIGHISTSGRIFPPIAVEGGFGALAAGPDLRLWFGEAGGLALGRVTPDGRRSLADRAAQRGRVRSSTSRPARWAASGTSPAPKAPATGGGGSCLRGPALLSRA